MNNQITVIALFLINVFIASVSQIILKKSAQISYSSVWKEYINYRVIIAYILFFGVLCGNFFLIKYLPLSLAAVLESSSYVFTAILCRIFLKEHLTKCRIIGLLCIILGGTLFIII